MIYFSDCFLRASSTITASKWDVPAGNVIMKFPLSMREFTFGAHTIFPSKRKAICLPMASSVASANFPESWHLPVIV